MGNISILGSDLVTFILFTVVFAGGIAFMTGHALAVTWRPIWQVVPYSLLLGAAERFFVYALFGGELLSITGYIIDTIVLMMIAVGTYRATLARRMVVQYPWMFERSGLFAWRKKGA
ncbi:MAG: DUF6867 family protein [Rhodospirillaceae bacterium]